MADTTLSPRRAFPDLPSRAPAGCGVIAEERRGLGLATMMLRKGQAESLRSSLLAQYGIDLPKGPRRTIAGPLALAGIGPATWLASHENGGNAFAESFRHSVTGSASVANQSDGYAVMRLTGARVRGTLAKGIMLDLHERTFEPNRVAVTDVSHIGIVLWRLPDAASGAPVFEIAVFRSLAASFSAWLIESAAEYGLGAGRPEM